QDDTFHLFFFQSFNGQSHTRISFSGSCWTYGKNHIVFLDGFDHELLIRRKRFYELPSYSVNQNIIVFVELLVIFGIALNDTLNNIGIYVVITSEMYDKPLKLLLEFI